ncbi:Glutamyl-tRNA(Gln) amidotransferase subunit A [Diaporthe eres]|nr:Glutamyl-tRNA(Gln) amidotransferase subunit A [Diaporthe eres]
MQATFVWGSGAVKHLAIAIFESIASSLHLWSVCGSLISMASPPPARGSRKQSVGYPVAGYPMADYPMADYPMVDYPMVDYPMVDYPMVDYPMKASRFNAEPMNTSSTPSGLCGPRPPGDVAISQAKALDDERRQGNSREEPHHIPIIVKEEDKNGTTGNLDGFTWALRSLTILRREGLPAVSITAGFATLGIGTETGGSNVFPASISELYDLTLQHGSVADLGRVQDQQDVLPHRTNGSGPAGSCLTERQVRFVVRGMEAQGARVISPLETYRAGPEELNQNVAQALPTPFDTQTELIKYRDGTMTEDKHDMAVSALHQIACGGEHGKVYAQTRP